jgi:hypothetical protein
MSINPKEIDKLYKELDVDNDFINHDLDVKKRGFAKQLNEFGEELIENINDKVVKKEKLRQSKIKYILKYGKNKFGDKTELMNTPMEDVESIYILVKELKKPWYIKLFEMLIGVNNE